MKKLLLTALTLALVITGATVVLAQTGGGAPSPGVDISGPCDEAEHATDPGCAGSNGVQMGNRGDDDSGRDDSGRDHPEDDGAPDSAGVEISGNCDEAEHAADPECRGVTGTAPFEDDNSDRTDNSGPGSFSSGDDEFGDDEFDDDGVDDDD